MAPARPGCWTWSRVVPSRLSRTGSPTSTSPSVTVSRSSRWTASPASKPATTEDLPVAVMDPFHAVRLAGDAMDDCRRRVQEAIHGHRGHTGDPLYTARHLAHRR